MNVFQNALYFSQSFLNLNCLHVLLIIMAALNLSNELYCVASTSRIFNVLEDLGAVFFQFKLV